MDTNIFLSTELIVSFWRAEVSDMWLLVYSAWGSRSTWQVRENDPKQEKGKHFLHFKSQISLKHILLNLT